MTLRRNLIIAIVFCLVGSVAGSGLAGAQTVKHRHRKHHRHHRRHRHRRNASAALAYMGSTPAPSLFGVDTTTYDKSYSNFMRDFPTARSLGSHWVHFTGDSIKFHADGSVYWGTMDYEVTQAREHGLGVVISLGGDARACSLSPRPTDFTTCPPTTSADLAAYESFVRAEVVRYRNVVQYYESWVEENRKFGWLSGPSPRLYARLLEAQYQVIQSVNQTYHTHIKLLFGSPIIFGVPPSSTTIPVLPFVHEVLANLHGARVFDAIALHAYRFPSDPNGSPTTNWGPTESAWDYVGGIPDAPGASSPFPNEGCDPVYSGWCQMTWRGELSAYEQDFADSGYPNMPLWITEFGWPGDANATDAVHPSYATQAQWLTEAYDDLLNLPFVQAAFWFNQRDYQPGLANPDAEYFGHYGLLEYGFAPKPAATAFQQIVSQNPGR